MRVEIITSTFLALLSRALSLDSNLYNNPQLLHEGTSICYDNHMGDECEVELDVPSACVENGVSNCPIVIMLHDEGQENDFVDTFFNVHEHNWIGVYPEGKCGGWNTYPRDCNECDYNNYSCVGDADDVGFIKDIIEDIRSRGAKGNIYAIGNKNGAALALKLAVNADDITLPIKGIITTSWQLLLYPLRSGPGETNFNLPQYGAPFVSVLSIAGTSDPEVPYEGGQISYGFELMPSEESIATWASHNLCRLNPTESTVSVTDKNISVELHVFENCALAVIEHYKVVGGEQNVRDIVLNGMNFTELSAQFIGEVERKLITEPVNEQPVIFEIDDCLDYFDPTMISCFDHEEWFVLNEGVNLTCAHVANNTELCDSSETYKCANATIACAMSCNPICEKMIEMVIEDEEDITEMPSRATSETPSVAPTVLTHASEAPTEAIITAYPSLKTTSEPSVDFSAQTEPPTAFVCEDDYMWVSLKDLEVTCETMIQNSLYCDWLGTQGLSGMQACPKSCNACTA